jgi:DNA primase
MKSDLEIVFAPGEISVYVAARLPNLMQVRGREWRAPCPIHRGQDDNFALEPGTGMWFCHSRCGRGGNLLALEMELSGVEFAAAKRNVFQIVGRHHKAVARRSAEPGPIVATYDYTDEACKTLYQITRHFPPKDFRQRYQDESGHWVWRKHHRQVLYRLPKVLASPIVFLVEGERDVETLEANGFIATTKSGGAGTEWLSAYTDALQGREVVLLPDNDETGLECGVRTARALLNHVKRLMWVVFPQAKDVTEWFEAGHSELELIGLVEAGLEFPN